MIKIATCQYQIESLSSWDSYQHKIQALCEHVKNAHAQLLLMPEYAGIEIGGSHRTDKELYAAIQPLLPKYLEFYKNLARTYQIYIQPGTILVSITPGQYINRAYFFSPNGEVGYQDKLQLIEYEKASQLIQYGKSQALFETSYGKIGIAICYDCEFPEIVRKLVDAGAWLILVPSYTITLHGYHRVFLSARARALENQCYVATSYVVGAVSNTKDIESTVGSAAVLGPIDNGFSDNGIIAQGQMNTITIVTAELSFEKLILARRQGQVHLFEDNKRCRSLKDQEVKIIRL